MNNKQVITNLKTSDRHVQPQRFKQITRLASKLMPHNLSCWPMMSEADVGHMAVEAEPSRWTTCLVIAVLCILWLSYVYLLYCVFVLLCVLMFLL
jgi:hypothetical protein